MNTRMKMTASLLGVMLSAAAAQAGTITLDITLGQLFKADGTTLLPEGSTVVILVDTNSNGFGNLDQANSFSPAADDVVLARYAFDSAGSTGVPGVAEKFISGIDYDTFHLAAGMPLLAVWYDQPYAPSATGPGAGVHYGFYRNDVALDGGQTWTVPNVGNLRTITLLTATPDVGGSSPVSAGISSHTTAAVPEPASLALLALGGTVLTLRRRHA